MRRPTPHSWLIGLRAARANFWPGLFVQLLMLALVLGYYHIGSIRPWFDWLGNLKRDQGYGFSVPAAALAGGVLPELLKIVFFQRGHPNRKNVRDLLFGMCFWGWSGFMVDAFYRWQTVWFGSGVSLSILMKKVAVDQFIYNPLLAAPLTVGCYEWKNCGFGRRAFGGMFTARFYGEKVFPALVATWGVWFPLVSLIYSLPPLLQIPLFNLALCFWVLLVAYITSAQMGEAV